MKYSLKMQQAFIDLVQKYEQAIVNLEYGDVLGSVKQRWRHYGEMYHCPLCQACQFCSGCVLGSDGLGCAAGTTMGKLRQAESRSKFLQALQERLVWILQRAEGNGITLEE